MPVKIGERVTEHVTEHVEHVLPRGLCEKGVPWPSLAWGGGTPGAYHSGLSYLRGTHYESVPGKSIPYVENGSSASRCWLFNREGWD